MEITFYGTGSCTPSPKQENKIFRSYSGLGIKIGSDSLLFDIGSGVLHKMLSLGIDILEEPTHLFISHFHPDHCSDIVALMQGRGVGSRSKTIKPLFIAGPDGLIDFCKDLFENVRKWKSLVDPMDIYKLLNLKEAKEGIVLQTKDWKVSSSPVKHFDGVCYKLEVGGKTIVYSGDMGYEENFSVFGKGADIAIMECSYPDKSSLIGEHLCPEDIGKLAKLGKFKKVVLTHLYPFCEGKEEEMIAKVKEFADVEVVVAYDFLRLTV